MSFQLHISHVFTQCYHWEVSSNENWQGGQQSISYLEKPEALILPEEAAFGRRLCKARTPLSAIVGSDAEWEITLSTDPGLFLVVEGTSRSRVWAFSDGVWGKGCSGDAKSSFSKSSPCLETCRPVERLPESGSGKVPIPLSNVLIWQQDSETQKDRLLSVEKTKNHNRGHLEERGSSEKGKGYSS